MLNLKNAPLTKEINGELLETQKIRSIPIVSITICCEKLFAITSIPLKVKAITIHKSRGMSIGPGKSFESVIVSLLKKGEGRILVQN